MYTDIIYSINAEEDIYLLYQGKENILLSVRPILHFIFILTYMHT